MSLSKYLPTVDNQSGRPTPLLIVPGIGRRSVRVTGAARTTNGRGPQAACLIWGTAFRVG